IDMLRQFFFKALATIFLIQTQLPVIAMPTTPEPPRSCPMSADASKQQCPDPSGVIRVFDSRASMGGGNGKGGRSSSCWTSCFNDYNQCLDNGQSAEAPKKACVARMKTCLAVCDHLSER